MAGRSRETSAASKRAPAKRAADVATHSPRHARILGDLELIFLREGFLAFRSVDELARRLHASKQTLYRLAPSREDLFLLVIDRFLETWRARSREAIEAADDWVSALTGYLDAGVEQTRDVGPRFLHDLHAFERGRKLMRRHQIERIAGLEALLKDALQARALNEINPRLVATVILEFADTLIDPEFQSAVGLTMSELCAQVYELLIHGLAPRTAGERHAGTRAAAKKRSEQTPARKRTASGR